MQEKSVTNEELARMIAEGFANTATKQGIEGLSVKVSELEVKVDKLEVKVDGIDERLIIVERKLDKALYREFQRVDKLEEWAKKVGEKIGINLEK